MRDHGYEMIQALDFVKSKRHQVLPNKGFLKQLKQFEYDLADAKRVNEVTNSLFVYQHI